MGIPIKGVGIPTSRCCEASLRPTFLDFCAWHLWNEGGRVRPNTEPMSLALRSNWLCRRHLEVRSCHGGASLTKEDETTNMGFSPLLSTPWPIQHRMLAPLGDCGAQTKGYTTLGFIPPVHLPAIYPGQKMVKDTVRRHRQPVDP